MKLTTMNAILSFIDEDIEINARVIFMRPNTIDIIMVDFCVAIIGTRNV